MVALPMFAPCLVLFLVGYLADDAVSLVGRLLTKAWARVRARGRE